MRATFLTGFLALLTASQAVAQTPPPATLPPATTGSAPMDLPGPGPAPALPLDDGRPFSMWGSRAWANGDYTLFWYTPMNCPPLIQTVPAVLVTAAPPSTIATTFPSKSQIHYDGVSGARVNFGANWDKFGVDFSGFMLQQRNLTTSLATTGTPVAIGEAYVNAADGVPMILYLSAPTGSPFGQYNGAVTGVTTSQLWGMEMNARRAWYVFMSDSTNLLAGFRYMDLRETIDLASLTTFPSGTTLAIADSIRTHNSFYGGQVGFNAQVGGLERGFGMMFTTKLGIGGVHQRVELVGSNTFTTAGVPNVETGGLYARGANIGTFSRGKFAFMQDLDLKLTYNFSARFQVSCGYSLFYLSSVVRPGDEIDPGINESAARFIAMTTPSNVARPVFAWRSHGFVVQGLTFGLRVQY